MAHWRSPSGPERPSRPRLIASLLLLCLVASLLAAAFVPVSGLSGGGTTPADSVYDSATKKPGAGCTCHGGGSASATVTWRLVGLPTKYAPAKSYSITLAGSGGPEPLPGQHQGGFAIQASVGTLTPLSGAGDVQSVTPASGMSALTHTADGNSQRQWSFTWTAPKDDAEDAFFYVGINLVDGSGAADAPDSWVTFQQVSEGNGAPPANEADISELGVPLQAYWLGVIGIFSVLFTLFLTYFVIRSSTRHHRGFRSTRVKLAAPQPTFGDRVLMGAAFLSLLVMAGFTLREVLYVGLTVPGRVVVGNIRTWTIGPNYWVYLYLAHVLLLFATFVALRNKNFAYRSSP